VQQVNVSAAPTWVFTPVSSLGRQNTLQLWNNGLNPAYFGQSAVTVNNGVPVMPNQVVRLVACTASVYLHSGFATTATSTTTNAAYTAGTSTLVMATTALTTGFTASQTTLTYLQVGTGTSAECVLGTLVYQNVTVTTSPSLSYDHRSGATVCTVTPAIAQVQVTPGLV
jgi:hypothetical protein